MDDFAIMSDADIQKEYREAKNPELQLQILAQQNLTTVEHIRSIVDADTRPPLAVKRKHGKFQPEEMRLLERMWADGVSIESIAKTLHRSRASLAAYLKGHRDTFPCRVTIITDELKAEILRRRDAGERGVDIAAALGCSETTIYNVSKERSQKKHER